MSKGPLPKVAGQRQRRNKRPTVKMVPTEDGTPAPRLKWLKQTKDAWADYWASPVSDIVHRLTDGPSIVRYFSLADMRERAYRSYESKPFVDGAAGQKVVNPQAALMMRMDQEMRMMGQEMGMSAPSRLRLGIDLEAEKKGDDLNSEWKASDVDEKTDPRIKMVK